MKRYISVILGMFWLCLSSCSVKNDMTFCPCNLCVDFSQVPVSQTDDVFLSLSGKTGEGDDLSPVVSEYVNLMTGTKHFYTVPKDIVRICSVAQDGGLADPSGRLVIPLGSECPRWLTYYDEIDCSDLDSACDTVRLCRNHVVLHFAFKDNMGSVRTLEVRGEINGLDVHGQPSSGEFRARCEPVGTENEFEVCIPRQTEESFLTLDIRDEEGILKSFSLGDYIRDSGYDWTSSDLDDVDIVLDFVSNRLSLHARQWSEEKIFNLAL